MTSDPARYNFGDGHWDNGNFRYEGDIFAAVASRGVVLVPAGQNYKALCPFHEERTPSFYVFPETNSWRCFSHKCGLGGSPQGFLLRWKDIHEVEL